MQAKHYSVLRGNLRGKALGLLDLLADGARVPTDTLFEGLNSVEGDFGPRAQRARIRRYATGLNSALAPHGWRVAPVGKEAYRLAPATARCASDAELLARMSRLRSILAGGVMPESPSSLRARRLLASICAIRARTAAGAAARDGLRHHPEFSFHLDQASLHRAGVRDVAVFW